MSAVLDAFKIKPFDLEPIYAAWKSPPIFQGNRKTDPPVEEWLELIKAGCCERGVPKDYRHKVAQNYMGEHAKGRFNELKVVMKTMHGGNYRWNWKRFKTAMKNMCWEIDVKQTEEIQLQRKSSGIWWITRKFGDKNKEEDSDTLSIISNKDLPSIPESPRPPTPHKSKSMWDIPRKKFPMPRRATTMSTVETVSSVPNDTCKPSLSRAPTMAVPPTAAASETEPGNATEVTHAPLWLVNACQSLEFLTGEHPKVMTALSAILITVGSIPAIPAISAGAGGAFLASGTAHAIGSIAVGLGTWLKAQSDGQVQVANPQGQTQAPFIEGGKH